MPPSLGVSWADPDRTRVVVPRCNGGCDRDSASVLAMPTPLTACLTGPAVRAEAWPLAAGAGLNVLQVGVTLASPWPLAFAVDRVIGADQPRPALLILAA